MQNRESQGKFIYPWWIFHRMILAVPKAVFGAPGATANAKLGVKPAYFFWSLVTTEFTFLCPNVLVKNTAIRSGCCWSATSIPQESCICHVGLSSQFSGIEGYI
jgi:hypothetical protein